MPFGISSQDAKYSYGAWSSFAHYSENFEKSCMIEKWDHLFEIAGFGTHRVKKKRYLPARAPARQCSSLHEDLYVCGDQVGTFNYIHGHGRSFPFASLSFWVPIFIMSMMFYTLWEDAGQQRWFPGSAHIQSFYYALRALRGCWVTKLIPYELGPMQGALTSSVARLANQLPQVYPGHPVTSFVLKKSVVESNLVEGACSESESIHICSNHMRINDRKQPMTSQAAMEIHLRCASP